MSHQRQQVELRPVTTVREASRIAWRWGRAFSTLRTRGRRLTWLQWFSYPANWLAGMLVLGVRGTDVRQLEVSYVDQRGRRRRAIGAVSAPNPVTRPSRRSWRSLATAGATLGGVILLGALPGLPAAASLLAIVVILLIAVAFIADRVPAQRIHNRAGKVADTKAELERRYPRAAPIQVLSMLGSWPHGHGAGWPLFDAVLHEYGQSGVSMMLMARDAELAQQYVARGGVVVDANRPLNIAWLNE
jgi:hypothetical protein